MGSLRTAGAILTDGDSGSGWTQTADTLQCCHCNTHWIIHPGSGIERGWCLKCMGPTCGLSRCYQCTPFEQVLDEWERRRSMSAALDYIRSL